MAISGELLSSYEADHLLNTILRLLHKLVQYDTAAVHMVQGDVLCTRAGVGAAENTVGQINYRKDTDYVWQYIERERAPYVTGDVHQEPWQPLAGFESIRSFMAVPLVVHDRLIGVLTIDHSTPNFYDQSQVELVQIFANHAAIALENARLLSESQHRAHQLSLLHRITAMALWAGDFQEMLDTLVNHLGTLIDADSCYIALWDETLQRPVPAAASGALRERYRTLEVLPNDKTVTASVLATGKLLVIADTYNSPYLSRRLAEQHPDRSLIGLPLMAGDQKIGAAILAFHDAHDFSPDEIAICEQAANQASVAIAKAQLLHVERRQRLFTETQLAFSYRLMATTTLEGAVEALLDTIGEVADYDAGSVLLADPDQPDIAHVVAVSGYRDPAEALNRPVSIQEFPLLEELLRTRKPIYLPELRGEDRWQPGRQPDPQEVRSILLTPLLYNQQSEVLGSLTLKSYRPNAFSQEMRDHIVLLCNQTASAVRNLRLFEETCRRLNEVTVLVEISEKLNRTFELNEMLQFVLDQVMSILGQSTETEGLSGAIILREQPSDVLYMAASYNMSLAAQDFFNNQPFYVHDGTFATSILKGEWVELTTPEEVMQYVVAPPGLDLPELLNIPLQVASDTIGVITANRTTKDPTTRRLLATVAQLAGAAIQKNQLLAQARSQAVELMEAYEALHEMDRQRDEFIQNITHDLRAPLTFIQGYTELMAEGALGEISEEQKEALEIIQERTGAVQRLVNDILKMKQVESQSLKEEPVIIETIAHTAVRSALMSAKRAGVEIVLDIETEPNCVLGDPHRLGQVFDNLLSNAIKYSTEGGEIRVRIQRREAKVTVSVSDEGIGIPPEELDRIWNRYYRAESGAQKASGTGLGLANVRRIIEAHGGRIWVESDATGTTFTFELPRYGDDGEGKP